MDVRAVGQALVISGSRQTDSLNHACMVPHCRTTDPAGSKALIARSKAKDKSLRLVNDFW